MTPIRLQVGNCLAERGSGVISPGSHKQQSALLVLFDVVLCDVLLPRAYNAQATDQEKYGPLILLAHLPNPLRAKLLDSYGWMSHLAFLEVVYYMTTLTSLQPLPN